VSPKNVVVAGRSTRSIAAGDGEVDERDAELAPEGDVADVCADAADVIRMHAAIALSECQAEFIATSQK